MSKIYVDEIRFYHKGTEYVWCGYYCGTIFYSFEKGLKIGDVRAIGEYLFKVVAIDKIDFFTNRISWQSVKNLSREELRELKREIFDL